MTDTAVRILQAGILVYVILDDLRNFRIRNEAIAALIVLFVLQAVLGRQYGAAFSHGTFAAVMFILLLVAYGRGFLGGGDVKLLAAAFLWLGQEGSLLFSLFLLAFTILYMVLAKRGAVPTQTVMARTKIPFGPCIGAAWLATLAVA